MTDNIQATATATATAIATATATATARTRRGELYIPTHRDETAMNGAPDRLWLMERKKATVKG
jgi:hypothetical protein